MKNLDIMAKRDNEVMRILKTHEISHLIASTGHGELRLKLTFKGTGSDYVFILDAVPLEKEKSDELFKVYGGIITSITI